MGSSQERASPGSVSLREVTADTLPDVLRLRVADHQRRFVADNATSIAQAHFSKSAWFRAIHAGETPVGFLMLHADRQKAEYALWRFMIAAEHQGRGYGRRALELVIEHVRGLPGAEELRLSYVPGEGEPRPFYERLGFVCTGEEEDGERVMRLEL